MPSLRLSAFRALATARLAVRRRFRQDEGAYAVGLTIAVGCLGALAAVAVRYVVVAVQWLALHNADEPLRAARALGFPMIVVVPAAGGVLYGLILRMLRPGRGGAC